MARQADLRTVAHEVVVSDAERDQYEAEQGFPISDIGPDGTLVPAPRRPVYAPVVAVEFDDPSVVPSYGLDILGDAAARRGRQRCRRARPAEPEPTDPFSRTGARAT